jgi:hypothetical protein
MAQVLKVVEGSVHAATPSVIAPQVLSLFTNWSQVPAGAPVVGFTGVSVPVFPVFSPAGVPVSGVVSVPSSWVPAGVHTCSPPAAGAASSVASHPRKSAPNIIIVLTIVANRIIATSKELRTSGL